LIKLKENYFLEDNINFFNNIIFLKKLILYINKMNLIEKELNDAELSTSSLNDNELYEINGGGLMLFLVAVSGVCLLAYGAGYLYGKLTCEEEQVEATQ
jgi:lactobin A/cerein 7B family class IIb bacteriocin